MKKPINIKELLEIDINFIYENSVFKADLINKQNDSRNLLKFDLKSKLFELFDQFQISIFDNKAIHLEFNSENPKSDRMDKLIELIVNEYGTDENNQNAIDWNTSKYMTWWFKNDKHEQTYDEVKNADELYYGIMLDGMNEEQVSLVLMEYNNIDPKLNEKNWLQQQ